MEETEEDDDGADASGDEEDGGKSIKDDLIKASAEKLYGMHAERGWGARELEGIEPFFGTPHSLEAPEVRNCS